jgi:hypothetical protein
MHFTTVQYVLWCVWHWFTANLWKCLQVLISALTVLVVWRIWLATSAQAKAARAQNNMSIKLLHASMGATDKQTMPLITLSSVPVWGEVDKYGRTIPAAPEFTVKVRNRGLGPALSMSAFLEARRDTDSGRLFARRECELDTTFLPVEGETTLAIPSAFIFQPLVVEYSSAMNTVYESRLEHGETIKQSNKMLHCEYEKLADMTFDD